MVINSGAIAAVIAATNTLHQRNREQEKREQKKREKEQEKQFRDVIQDTYIRSEESKR